MLAFAAAFTGFDEEVAQSVGGGSTSAMDGMEDEHSAAFADLGYDDFI